MNISRRWFGKCKQIIAGQLSEPLTVKVGEENVLVRGIQCSGPDIIVEVSGRRGPVMRRGHVGNREKGVCLH